MAGEMQEMQVGAQADTGCVHMAGCPRAQLVLPAYPTCGLLSVFPRQVGCYKLWIMPLLQVLLWSYKPSWSPL